MRGNWGRSASGSSIRRCTRTWLRRSCLTSLAARSPAHQGLDMGAREKSPWGEGRSMQRRQHGGGAKGDVGRKLHRLLHRTPALRNEPQPGPAVRRRCCSSRDGCEAATPPWELPRPIWPEDRVLQSILVRRYQSRWRGKVQQTSSRHKIRPPVAQTRPVPDVPERAASQSRQFQAQAVDSLLAALPAFPCTSNA